VVWFGFYIESCEIYLIKFGQFGCLTSHLVDFVDYVQFEFLIKFNFKKEHFYFLKKIKYYYL
jgi:hypothetical protein